MWEISDVKEKGKLAFKGNYWPCVLAAFLMGIFSGGASAAGSRYSQGAESNVTINSNLDPKQQAEVAAVLLGILGVALLIGFVIRIFLANPVKVGGSAFFKSNVEATPAPFSLIKVGFQNYGHTFVTLFLKDLYLIFWFLLLFIPGCIKMYSYRMVPYILAENPDMPANEIITRSREMMDGNKWQAFLLDLSFIGWILLGIVTLGLGLVFWTAPYMQNTNAALYLKLKEKA